MNYISKLLKKKRIYGIVLKENESPYHEKTIKDLKSSLLKSVPGTIIRN